MLLKRGEIFIFFTVKMIYHRASVPERKFSMSLQYSYILPMKMSEGQKTFRQQFDEAVRKSKSLKIAVGYISLASLLELEKIVDENGIEDVTLIIGMYVIEGFPERCMHETVRVAEKWKKEGKGEIRLVTPFKYHGKFYCFYSLSQTIPDQAFVGSANLSVLCPDASTRRQYELSMSAQNEQDLRDLHEHFNQLCRPVISRNILDFKPGELTVIREVNTSLQGVEQVTHLPLFDREYYNHQDVVLSFDLPIKVPKKAERFLDDKKHFTKSNINVCYASPRSKGKNRDWYEMQLTVSKDITERPGYPKKNVPFFIITDDGYLFKAHTTSQNNKQFSAVGDELIMGRWFKGRLASAGLVHPVNDTGKDVDRTGSITQEMLDAYGVSDFRFEKTACKVKDENGKELDLWKLSLV